MATYQELFPEYADTPLAAPFEPIKVGRLQGPLNAAKARARTALDINGESQLQADVAEVMADFPRMQPEGETEWADVGKSFVSGAGGLAASGAGALEYLGNKFADNRTSPIERGVGDVADWFTGARHSAEQFSQDWFQSMTPEAQARSQRDILSLDPNNTIWQGGVREILSSIGLKMSQSAPSALVTLLPGAILMRVGLAGGVTYLGASEGVLSMGSIAANIASEVERAPEAQLMQAPRYAALRQQMGESQARQQLITEAQGHIPAIGGLVVGAISAVTGKYFQPIITDKASGIAGRFMRGAVNEGVFQEAPQSAAEQIAQNVAAQTFDAGRGTFQGAGEAAAQGAVAGGPMGGTIAAMVGQGPSQQPLPESEATIPDEAGTEAFGEVFGEQAPPPGGTGWRGGDIEFPGYDQTANVPPVPNKKGKLIAQPQVREQQFNATGQKMMDVGPVDRDLQAALNIRRDKTMDDMFEKPPFTADPEGPIQQGLEKAGQIYQQGGMFDTTAPPPPPPGGGAGSGWRGLAADLARTGEGPPLEQQDNAFQMRLQQTEQPPLGVTDEQGRVIRPTPAAPATEDLTLPDAAASNQELALREAEAARVRQGGDTSAAYQQAAQLLPQPLGAGTARDVRQRDLLNTPEELQSMQEYANDKTPFPAMEDDEPTAEPKRDIRAQLEDLADPDHPRLGVYLSPANIARLGQVPTGVGVPLANFDGKGGVLIAKNRQVAEEVLHFRDSGQADMQEILGFVTGAGGGKPRGAQIAVQQRDEQGNVVLESVVASPEEADQLAEQLDEPNVGRQGVVLSVEMALKRRAQRIAAEEAAEKTQQITRGARQRVSETDAESRYLPGTHAHEVAAAAAILRERIAQAEEAQSEARNRSERLKAAVTEQRLRDELEALESRVESRVAKTAPEPLFKDRRAALENLSDEEVAKLSPEQINELFGEAAIYASGARQTRGEDTEGVSFGGDTSTGRALQKEMRKKEPASPHLTRYETLLKLIDNIDASLKAGVGSNRFGDGITDMPELTRFKELLPVLERVNKSVEKNPQSKHWTAQQEKVTAEIKAINIVKRLKDRRKAALTEIATLRKELDKPAHVKAPSRAVALRLEPLKKRLKETRRMLELAERVLDARPKNIAANKRRRDLTRIAMAMQSMISRAEATGKLPKYRDADFKAVTTAEPTGRESHEREVEQAQVASASATSEFAPSGKTVEEIEAAHPTKSEKIAFILRQKRNLRVRAAGSKVKTTPITAEGELREGISDIPSKKKAEPTATRTAELQPTKALDLEPPREMGPEKRKAHKKREKAAYKALDGNLATFASKGMRIAQIFERNSFEREAAGNPPHWARNAIYGRAYFGTLYQYGQMLQALHPRSNAGLGEVERFNRLIEKLLDAPSHEFLDKLSIAMQAESEHQARVTIKGDPTVFKRMGKRKQRRASLDKLRLLKRIADAKKLHDKHHENAEYEHAVAPVVQKLLDYVTKRRSQENIPTFGQMRALRYAMQDFKKSDRKLYTALKKWLQYFSYQFDAEGDLKLARNMTPALVRTRNAEDLAGGVTAVEAAAKREQQARKEKIEKARQKGLTPEELRRHRLLPAERLIEDLRKQLRSLDLEMMEAATQEQAAAIMNATMDVWNRYTTMAHGRPSFMPSDREKDFLPKWVRAGMYKERARRMRLTDEQRATEDRAIEARLGKHLESRRSHLRPGQVTALDRPPLRMARPTRRSGNRHYAGTQVAAEAVAAHLEEHEAVSANDLLYALAAKLPSKHPYRTLVRKLLDLGLNDVSVWFDEKLPRKTLGDYFQTKVSGRRVGAIRLNRSALEEIRAGGTDASGAFVHTLLHEMVHAATMGALENNRALHAKFELLMRDTVAAAVEQGVSLLDSSANRHYGITEMSVDEFVAEAFTNAEFQDFLIKVKLTPKYSVWDKIIDTIMEMFGVSKEPESIAAFQAVMAHHNQLFTGEWMKTRGTKVLERVNDNFARTHAGNVLDRMMQTNRVTRAARERGWKRLTISKEHGPAGILSGITMEQLRDMYEGSFGGKSGGLRKYMDAFFQRNADSSANMETPDRISKLWTSLRVADPKKAVEFSKILTEASLYGVHPDRPSTAKGNEHIKSEQQLAKHADLHRRFRALGSEVAPLYNQLRDYYADTIRKQSNLVVLNSLRAILDKADKYTEADVERLKLNTKEGLKKEFGEQLSEVQRKLITRLATISQSNVGPYFPLMRFGEYVVTADVERESQSFSSSKAASAWATSKKEEDPTLSVSSPIERGGVWVVTVHEKEVRMAESQGEAETERLAMVAKYGAENVDREVQLKSHIYEHETMANSMAGLRSILSNLKGNPAAQQAIKDFYLRSLADNSFRKHEARKERRRGVNDELQHRTFASYAKAASYYMAQLRFGAAMGDGIREMDKYAKAVAGGEEKSDTSAIRLGQVLNEITTRDNLTHDPVEIGKKTRFATEVAQLMMLLSPSYWIINATQPYMVTLPWLAAQSNVATATAALVNAQKLIAHPITNQMTSSLGGLKALWSKQASEGAFSVLDDVLKNIETRGGARGKEYLAMLKTLKQYSILDLSSTTEMRDIAEGQNTSQWQKVMDASRVMSHLTEVNNRIMTALAAYDLSRNKGESEADATKFAMDAVSQTQFNYSTANTARLFSAQGKFGPLGPLIFQFMKYPQHMWALLVGNFYKAVHGGQMERKVARRTLLGLATTHLAVAGLSGVMLQPIKWALGLVMWAFGSDDEPYTIRNAMSGATADRLIRRGTNALFGDGLADQVAAAGLPRLAGIDLSNRMSWGTLWMMDLKGDTSETALGSVAGSLGGPSLNIVLGLYDGYRYMQSGQTQKAWEAVMPKVLKDLSKMTRYTNEGLTNGAGMEIKGAENLSAWQIFAQSMGFQPSDIAEGYAQRNAMESQRSFTKDRRKTLLQRMNIADPAERAQIIANEVSEYNRGNPADMITYSQIRKSLVRFKERELRSKMFGLDLRDREMGLMEEAEPYVDEDENEFAYEE